MEETISVSDFKATCLDLFKRLDRRELKRVVVTRHGRTVAILTPPQAAEEEARAVHGSMAGMIIFPEDDYDLVAPIFDGVMDADQGILHR